MPQCVEPSSRHLALFGWCFGYLPTALAAYHWGPGRIGRWLRSGSTLPVHYTQRVLSTHAETTLRPLGAS
jgi:hypothetical protein